MKSTDGLSVFDVFKLCYIHHYLWHLLLPYSRAFYSLAVLLHLMCMIT